MNNNIDVLRRCVEDAQQELNALNEQVCPTHPIEQFVWNSRYREVETRLNVLLKLTKRAIQS
jgi:hypothetical protein